MPTSKRTWSLPLPVQPWAMYLRPAAVRLLDEVLHDDRPATSPRAADTCSRRARWPCSALARNSSTYSSRTSLTIDSTAPMPSAFWRTNSRSWRSWPTSIASAIDVEVLVLAEPLDGDRGVETAGVREYALLAEPCGRLSSSRRVRVGARAAAASTALARRGTCRACRRARSASESSSVITRIVSSPAMVPRISSSSAASSAAATPGAVPGRRLHEHEVVRAHHVEHEVGDHALQVQVLGEHVDALGQLRQAHLGDVARDRRLRADVALVR